MFHILIAGNCSKCCWKELNTYECRAKYRVNILREITPGSDRIGPDRITDRITDRIMDRITNQKKIEKCKKLNRL